MFVHLSSLALLLALPVALAQLDSSDEQQRRIGQEEHYLILINDICTGAVLSKSHIVTSATCATSMPIADSFARYERDNSDDPKDGAKIKFKAVKVHPEFESVNLTTKSHHNIAVIELEQPSNRIETLLGDNIIQIKAQDVLEDLLESEYLMGFETNEGNCANQLPRPHREVKLTGSRSCGQEKSAPIICAKPKLANINDCNKLACAGLLVQKRCNVVPSVRDDRVLLGVPTFGSKCDRRNQRLFVQVSKFSDWIMEETEATAKIFSSNFC